MVLTPEGSLVNKGRKVWSPAGSDLASQQGCPTQMLPVVAVAE